jgi:hypothetical protein
MSTLISDTALAPLTRECFGLFRGDRSQVLQITLVSDEHNDNVGVGVVPQFFEPSCDVDVSRVLADIVYKECSDGSAVIATGESLATE